MPKQAPPKSRDATIGPEPGVFPNRAQMAAVRRRTQLPTSVASKRDGPPRPHGTLSIGMKNAAMAAPAPYTMPRIHCHRPGL